MEIIKVVTSNDHTKKYFLGIVGLLDSHIEACLLNLARYGYIICVSSQIGCSQKCEFCAAKNSNGTRNLSSDEIQEQIRLVVEDNPQLAAGKFQVTYMGSGEPLSNYKNVFDSIDRIRMEYPNLSKVNISTTCPSSGRYCFENTDWESYYDFLHFQYSLHFVQDRERYRYLSPRLMKISEAINYLNRVSVLINDTYKVNYILFDGLNDSREKAEELKKIMDKTENAILKISTMCEIYECSLLPSQSFDQFSESIKKMINRAEFFSSDGTDVNAGCGQFYNESIL